MTSTTDDTADFDELRALRAEQAAKRADAGPKHGPRQSKTGPSSRTRRAPRRKTLAHNPSPQRRNTK
jgi:hypothetical protein